MRDPNLDLIVSRILTVAQPERIILFGSRARGEERPDSDYDLLVVEPSQGSSALRSAEIRRAIGAVGVGVDVLLTTSDELEEWKDGICHVYAVAQREGLTLYAA